MRLKRQNPARGAYQWLHHAIVASCVLAASAAPALSATSTDTMAVTATVVASCSVVANDLAFGNYNPVSATPLDGASSVDVTCTNGTAYVVSMNAGLGGGATVSARKMTSGANTLTYSLYRDASRTLVWGQTNGVDTLAGAGSGALQSLNIYGQAPAAQTAPAGAYADTITVTVTY